MAIYLFIFCIISKLPLRYTDYIEERRPDENERREEMQREAPFSVRLCCKKEADLGKLGKADKSGIDPILGGTQMWKLSQRDSSNMMKMVKKYLLSI